LSISVAQQAKLPYHQLAYTRPPSTHWKVSTPLSIPPSLPDSNSVLTTHAALSESLSYELAPLGIRVLIIQPGGFNTNFASSIQSPAAPMTADYEHTPIAAVLHSLPSLAGKQYGDTQKGCRAIFDVITKTGLAGGLDEDYLRIPLGTDCAKRLKWKFDGLQKGLEGTRVVWESTDLEGRGVGERTMLNFDR
jgi:hypothetical protein